MERKEVTDLASLVREYFIALDGNDDGDVSDDELRCAELNLRAAAFDTRHRLEAAVARLGSEHDPPPGWQGRVWMRLAQEGVDPRIQVPPPRLGRVRRAWRWLFHGWS